jgi:hypothetical protein
MKKTITIELELEADDEYMLNQKEKILLEELWYIFNQKAKWKVLKKKQI